MKQTYNRSSAEQRYSSRKPIFEAQSSSKGRESREGRQQNEEMYRIVAKVRSLDDDVRKLVDENL
jgi:hypothetical protein